MAQMFRSSVQKHQLQGGWCNLRFLLIGVQFLLLGVNANAGAQKEEALSSAFQLVLHQAAVNSPPPNPDHLSELALRDEYSKWVVQIGPKFERYLSSHHPVIDELATAQLRSAFLQTVWYESVRAKLEPATVMGLIQVESGFNKFAISSAGAVGYMQVMPFWMSKALESESGVNLQSRPNQLPYGALQSSAKLLHLQTNIRFGCTILRHYMDLEGESLVRALGRYNGNISDDSYARAVAAARLQWVKAQGTANN